MGRNVAELLAAVRAAWPDIAVDADELAAAVAAKHGDADPTDDQIAELGLALACARGDRAGLAAFEEHYLSIVPAALSRMRLAAADVDEIRQDLRRKLLVADRDRPARIVGYAGGGNLRGLVRVAAVRAAVSLLRPRKREVFDPDDDLLALPATEDDPELRAIKRQHRDEFRLAFEEAVERLSKRERTLLRLHALDGVTLEQLGKSYGVHKTTVSRWIASAREQLLDTVRERLREHLSLGPGELDSFVRVIQSRLDLSLRRLFDTRAKSDG